MKPFQIFAPAWTRDSRWNILANLPAGVSQDQVPEMMQALSADRFKLAIHREKREQAVYQFEVAPGGPKVEVSTGGEYKLSDGSFPGFNFGGGVLRGGTVISGRTLDQPNCGQRWEFIPLSMGTFADALTMFLDKPVMDETALNAETNVVMDQNMAGANGMPPPPPGAGGAGRRGPDGGQGLPPSPAQALGQCLEAAGPDGSTTMLFQAIQKLGLKLQQSRQSIEYVVVVSGAGVTE